MNDENKVDVSVVIPFFNRSSLLVRLLDSICQQTFPVAQIYLVDNGSSPAELAKCSRIVEEYVRRGYPLTWLSTIKKGNANIARNLGSDLAKTTYIAYLDSDDWWKPMHLDESIRALESSSRSASYSGSVVQHLGRVEIRNSIDVNDFSYVFEFLYGGKKVIAQTSSYVVKKQALERVRWDERMKRHQDTDFFIQMYYNTTGWLFVQSQHVVFDVASDGVKEIDFKSRIRFLHKWKSVIRPKELENYLKSQIVVAIRRRAPYMYIRYYKRAYQRAPMTYSPLKRIKCCLGYFEAREKLIRFVRLLGR